VSLIESLSWHSQHLRYALGKPRHLGGRAYRINGYFSDKFCRSDDHEPHLGEVIAALLRQREGAFIDIGVNVGQTLCKLLATGQMRRYVGFEPQIACCFYVDQFIRANDIADAHVIPVALGEQPGVLELHADDDDVDESASLDATGFRATMSATRKLLVPVLRGDAALGALGLKQIAVLKVDVEGAELDVLRGLPETLRFFRPAVLFEVLPNFFGEKREPIDAATAASHTRRADAIFALLSDAAYTVHQIDRDGRWHPIERFALDDREGFVTWDYLALPGGEIPPR
jgi:FkbM family methyltransferase